MDANDMKLIGMNLAEVGTECISRKAALDCFHDWIDKYGDIHTPDEMPEYRAIEALPSAQPDLSKEDWQLIKRLRSYHNGSYAKIIDRLVASAQPKRGRWILDRSGAYCCSECMEPCAGYVMMKPRDKFCKMCGAKMEVMG